MQLYWWDTDINKYRFFSVSSVPLWQKYVLLRSEMLDDAEGNNGQYQNNHEEHDWSVFKAFAAGYLNPVEYPVGTEVERDAGNGVVDKNHK